MSRIEEEKKEKIRVGGVIGGKYQLIRMLGEGGMGSVWEAKQSGMAGFSKPVALKLMLAEGGDEEARRMFLNEARISARLHHPNIVETYDLGQDGSIDYIAMERILGKDLDFLLRATKNLKEECLPWDMAAAIMVAACKGLHYAHNMEDDHGGPLNLIHRDLKPGNILVSYEGYAKVIDFGIAKASINDGKTKTGIVKGTPAYMAPEQIVGNPLDQRVDLFSFGAILYELCTGLPAFRGENLFSIIFAVQSKQPEPPTSVKGDIPEDLEAVIMKALEKDPNDRFQTAREFQKALEDVLFDHRKRIDHEDIGGFVKDKVKLTKGTMDMSALDNLGALAPTGVGFQDSGPVSTPNVAGPDIKDLPTQMVDSSGGMVASPQLEAGGGNRKLLLMLGVLILLAGGGIGLGLTLSKRETPKPPKRAVNTTLVGKTPRRKAVKKAPAKVAKAPAKRADSAPAKAAPAKGSPAKRAKKTRKRRVRVARIRKRRVLGKGTVVVDIKPRCTLFVNGRKSGSSRQTLKLPAGNHRLRCLNYRKRFNAFFPVKVLSGRTVRVARRLRKGQLFVLSFPVPSAVFLWAGKQRFGYAGRSHEKISLYEGEYRIEVRKRGSSQKRTITVQVKPGTINRPKPIVWK